VTWLDCKPYEEIPIYLSWFDACFIPFKNSDQTRYVNPINYWEYMASNKKILSTNFNYNALDPEVIKMTDVTDKIHKFVNNEYEAYNSYNEFVAYLTKLNKKVFVALPTIPWYCSMHQRPHHMASAFAKIGYVSIYTTNYSSEKLNKPIEKLADNLWLVKYHDDILKIKGAYYSFYSTTFGSDYNYCYTTIHKNGGFFVYEYIDHINEQISPDKNKCDTLLKYKTFALTGFADLIVPSSDALRQDVINTNHVLVKNGVDLDHYVSKKDKAISLGKSFMDFRERYSIVCGYFGAVASWLDYDILNAVAALRPDVGFVYIGPNHQNSVQYLKLLPNVNYMGIMNYKLLPYYAYKFDVCFIPFSKGEIAKTTSPLKLYEYFSLQKPVIASIHMTECVNYKEVLTYSTADEFSTAIDTAAKLINDTSYKSSLLRIAQENNWINRVKVYAEKLSQLVK
jgi:hypothetical protein